MHTWLIIAGHITPGLNSCQQVNVASTVELLYSARGNRSMHYQTLALFSLTLYSGKTLLLSFSEHWCVFLFVMFCVCSHKLALSLVVSPLEEFDSFIRSNNMILLYLSVRWCIFTLANYFVDALTTMKSRFICITNLRTN